MSNAKETTMGITEEQRGELEEIHGEDALRAAVEVDYAADFDRLRTLLEDGFIGCRTVEDYVHDLVEDGVLDVPEGIARQYFDFEAFGRDLQMGGDVVVVILDGETYLFDGHV